MRLSPRSRRTDPRPSASRPHYDRDRRELSLGGKLVKRLKQRAPDQTLILDAFEEQNWPARIANPLSPRGHGRPRKLRLNPAIYRLNRHQVHSLRHFRGDGTGEGVIWEMIAPRHRPASGQR